MRSTNTMADANTIAPPQIPDNLPIGRVLEAVRHLGLDADVVQELHLYRGRVEVEVYLRNVNGKYVAAGDEPAMAVFTLPIDHDDQPKFDTKLPGEDVPPAPVLDHRDEQQAS